MTRHRHYTERWIRCRDCGRPAADCSDYCPDCQLEIEERAAEAAETADYVPATFECTCTPRYASSAAAEPPDYILDRYCPLHGDGGPDPDAARDARLDQIRFERDFPSNNED